jgi:anionic cell wall polymer biosynthesis LytR-Cps2A-Psr (LCP) family protein
MIASYNPRLQTVSFLSIPRDLYIEDKQTGYKGKINGLFAMVYLANKDKL